MSTFSWVYKPSTLWDALPQKKSTHQHFLSTKNPYENNKNQAKKVKVYRKKKIFTDTPQPSPQKCMICTLVKMLTFMDGPKRNKEIKKDWTTNSLRLHAHWLKVRAKLIWSGRTAYIQHITRELCYNVRTCQNWQEQSRTPLWTNPVIIATFYTTLVLYAW